ncbi:MAG: Hsp20/alpha crystallin family protein [Candidatus Dadabacteria bacterium]|nr:Hsp20/alpha crystallin family protein [Candidatus Dadabacteria bacterium]NIS09538.1 Hsp20/alpha crystallin family protein [Candidatus Dadabacteria bacterium]NIV42750.1 Hsp20 family protein [Candidatus Dadabacteria bacterium]NIX16644.1 Hsp20 family protein [Candidatus Dadabacteria bacterium]NIY23185.1 Hsp20 family protein [Candidatus Dadabacteria bacterium]
MSLGLRLFEPGRELSGFDTFFDNAFGSLLKRDYYDEGRLSPSVDVYEKSDKYVINAEIPGLSKDEIKIDVKDGALTISGEKKYEDKKEDENYIRVERRYGKFERRFNLPENVNVDKVTANYKNGVLEVSLPKKEEAKPKQIDVKVS